MILRLATILSLMLAIAAEGATTARYLVATRSGAMGENARAIVANSARHAGQPVVELGELDGFAATLTEQEVETLRASPNVRWVEPVVERHAFAGGTQTTPWGLEVIHAPESRAARGASEVNIVVIDSGIDLEHPDLRDAYAGGINILDLDEPPVDEASHGTHVAGIIAARDNDFGVVGVAPRARLWIARILDKYGRGNSEGLVHALDWALARKRETGGRWIVNLSLGAQRSSELEREAVARLTAEGMIVVAATGNSEFATAPVAYPAAYPGVIAVGAVDVSLTVPQSSNRGPETDFAAPGIDVISTLPPGFAFESVVSRSADAFVSAPLEYSSTGEVTALVVDCGFGKPGEFPSDIAGRIALIRRGGELSFGEKAANALAAGAAGSIIFNDVDAPDSALTWTLGKRMDPAPLAVAVSLATGEALKSHGGVATIAVRVAAYGRNSGTSMAAPHVTGALALLWSIAPDASPEVLVNALITTAVDIDVAGFDIRSGHGVPNVYEAARQLAPGAFDGRPQTGRRAVSRRR